MYLSGRQIMRALLAVFVFTLAVPTFAQTDAEKQVGVQKFLSALREKYPTAEELKASVHYGQRLNVLGATFYEPSVTGDVKRFSMDFSTKNDGRADVVGVPSTFKSDFASTFYKENLSKDEYSYSFGSEDKTVGSMFLATTSNVDRDIEKYKSYLVFSFDNAFIEKQHAAGGFNAFDDNYQKNFKKLSLDEGYSVQVAPDAVQNFGMDKLIQIYRFPTLAYHFKYDLKKDNASTSVGGGMKSTDVYQNFTKTFPGVDLQDMGLTYRFEDKTKESYKVVFFRDLVTNSRVCVLVKSDFFANF